MQAQELGHLLQKEIPLSRAMGITDFQFKDYSFSFRLPLPPNINHKATAFGGSLYSAGALACYGLFLHGLRENQITTNNIVISEGTMKYLKPIDGDASVQADWPSEDERSVFFKTLLSKKKARIPMRAQISLNGIVCAEFDGDFVAVL